MYSRIGAAAYKKDLDNIIRLCDSLNNPQQEFKSIHVAGTNGKGSTSCMLAAILQEAGYKTGLYTSPHIKDFRERIRINGEMISKQFVVGFVESTNKIALEIEPSFFELTVAMAFEYFKREKVDIAIIETGLGGRLDSTNIISPILSVITNIGYDHVQILGNTLPDIAREKAGIIKKNVPVVLPETMPVFIEKANETKSQIHFTQEEYTIEYIESTGSLLLCNVKELATGIVEKLRLDLIGLYQTKNACTVLNCINILRKSGFSVNENQLHKGFENVSGITGLRGRWEVLETKPAVILDVAHNEEGIRQVIEQLKLNYAASGYHFVIGFVNDKELEKILMLFPPDSKYYFTNAHIPRGLSNQELKKMAADFMLEGDIFDNVNDAIKHAKINATANDVVMVCGSFFIVAEVQK